MSFTSDPYLTTFYPVYSLVSNMTDPNAWFDKDLPDEFFFMVDVQFVPEGEEDQVGIEILTHNEMNIIFFLWKTFEDDNKFLHIQYKNCTWSLKIKQGNILNFQYWPRKKVLWCAEGVLDKRVGWPEHRISIATMFRELEEKAKSKASKVSINSFRWFKRVTANYLKEVEIDVYERTQNGKSLLHLAARIPHPFLLQCLIDKFENVNLVDQGFMTPLHEACKAGCLENAKLLLEYGANVNALTSQGNTPLMFLAYRNYHEPKFVKLLLKHNAKCDVENNNNMRAIDIARQICKSSPIISLIHPLFSQVY